MEADHQTTLEGGFHAAPLRDTPGKLLQAAREARGLSAQQLCEAIQLEPRYLAALEEDRFEVFDAPVFARGFLRKSATFLGLDPAVLLDGYDRLQRGPVAPTHIPPTMSRIKPKRVSPWRLPMLGFAVLVAVALLVWWLVKGLGGFGAAALDSGTAAPMEAPATLGQSLVESPAVAAPAAPADVAPAPQPAVGVAPDLGASGNVGAEAPAPGAAGADLAAPAAAPVAPAAAPAGGAPAAPAARAELLLQLSSQCWVNVNGPDGRRLYVGMASPGVLRFAGTGPWQVLLGDSRQAKLSVGGRDVAVPVQQNRDNYVVRFTVTADGQVR